RLRHDCSQTFRACHPSGKLKFLDSPEEDLVKSNPIQLAAGLALVAFALFVVLSTYYTVDQGQRAVVLHYSAVAGESEPGLHFKYPFVTTVQKISIQPQTFNYGSKDQPFEAYSKDQQPANLELSVTFHVTNVSKLYALYGSAEG